MQSKNTREAKFCRMVHLSKADPESEEYKLLKSLMDLTGEDIKGKIADIRKRQQELTKQHIALQMEVIDLMELCPHGSRHRYRAAGVETDVCDYCGDQEWVRDY